LIPLHRRRSGLRFRPRGEHRLHRLIRQHRLRSSVLHRHRHPRCWEFLLLQAALPRPPRRYRSGQHRWPPATRPVVRPARFHQPACRRGILGSGQISALKSAIRIFAAGAVGRSIRLTASANAVRPIRARRAASTAHAARNTLASHASGLHAAVVPDRTMIVAGTDHPADRVVGVLEARNERHRRKRKGRRQTRASLRSYQDQKPPRRVAPAKFGPATGAGYRGIVWACR